MSSLHQRLDAIAANLHAKPDIDLSKLTTEQLRYVARGEPIPLTLLTDEAVEALRITGYEPPAPLKDLTKPNDDKEVQG